MAMPVERKKSDEEARKEQEKEVEEKAILIPFSNPAQVKSLSKAHLRQAKFVIHLAAQILYLDQTKLVPVPVPEQ